MAELETEELEETESAAFSAEEDEEPDEGIPEDPGRRKRKKRIIIFSVIGGIILALIILNIISGAVRAHNAAKNMYKDVAVERRTITKSITGSSSTEPKDSYNVMTMKSGDITADYFREGDTVKKGDKLYQFDDEDARNSLKSAQNALTKADQAYVDAVKQKAQTISSNNIATKSSQNAISKSLNGLTDARESYNDQYIKSDISGKVVSLSVKEGDSISMGTPIATVYSDTYMKIRLPFNDYDAESVYEGAPAEVTVTGSGDTIYGTVTEKSTSAVATDAHTMVVYVTIEVTNPGALTENDRGSAVVNGVACSDSSDFEYISMQKITAKTSGTLRNLYVAEGDSISAGGQLGYIESTSASTALNNAQLNYDDAVLSLQRQVLANDTYSQDSAIKNAQLSLDDARINLKKAEDAVKDMVVEAPIDGTVVKKNAKNGDTRDSSNSTEALCVIYDLSSLKIKLDVDETEIAMVKTGLKAKITADAVEDEFQGEVTKVPVDGVNENGVTTYTIEVEIDEYGDLLPGMNVDAEIIVEEAENVLSVPVNSVNRGDIVFVKDDGRKRENDITDIINNKAQKDGGKKDKEAKEAATPQPTLPVVSGTAAAGKPKKGIDESKIPANIEIPKGYLALQVETGVNDNDYIEIKSGLTEDDSVRTLNIEYMSKIYTDDTDIMAEMEQSHDEQRRQMQGGGMSGGGPQGGGPGGR